jgi:hypothetical protein
VYEEGSKYDGEWKDDKKHGKGVYVYEEGSKYDGEWKDDKKHGKGVMVYKGVTSNSSGQKYDGEFQDGKRHGKGVYVYEEGSKYDGEWKDGQTHGKGVLMYKDGAKYDGEFQHDKRHGKGVMVCKDGTKQNVAWNNGVQINLAEYKRSADTEFHGQTRKKMRINAGVSSVGDTNQKQEGPSVASENHWQTVFDLANSVTEKEHGT